MALFLLKECDRMRYFLNVLWDYKIEDTYEKTKKMLLCRFNMQRQKCLITLKAKIHWWECVLCLENYPMEKPCSFLSFNNCQSLLYTSYWSFFVSLSHLKHISVWSHLHTRAHIYYPDKILEWILKFFFERKAPTKMCFHHWY